MTKKHYVQIAKIILDTKNKGVKYAADAGERNSVVCTSAAIALSFCEIAVQDNRNFNKHKFLAACGVN